MAPLFANSINLPPFGVNFGSSSINLKGDPEWALPSFKGLTSKWESMLITPTLLGELAKRAEILG